MEKFKIIALVLNLFFLIFCFACSYFQWTGKLQNPIILTGIWLIFAVLVFYLFSGGSVKSSETPSSKILGSLFAVASIIPSFSLFRESIKVFNQPVVHSDVIPQLEAQYHWFAKGEFPYQVLQLEYHAPFPVYMPMHWLPIGISSSLDLDSRWSGFLVLAIVFGVIGYKVGGGGNWIRILALLLLGLPLYAFLKWGGIEIPVSYELVIAAYYLLLCLGLLTQNLLLIILGISFCLLSRFTLVFWLPLFAMLFWWKEGWRKSLVLWGGVSTIVVVVYIIPFLSHDFSILTRGLQYHNSAAIAEWVGYKETGISYTIEKGINFAGWMKQYFQGSMEEKVYKARILQAGCMLLLFFSSLFFYKKIQDRIGIYDYCLVMLFLFINTFYFFGPLTYQYYLLTPLYLSAFLTIAVFALKPAQNRLP